jgi:hypothetical protein
MKAIQMKKSINWNKVMAFTISALVLFFCYQALSKIVTMTKNHQIDWSK